MEESEVFVYIIETHFGTYYTGITNNLLRRWKEHKAGQSSYLSKSKPKQVIYSVGCINRRSAHKLEVKIKRVGALKYLNKLRFENVRFDHEIILSQLKKHGTHN